MNRILILFLVSVVMTPLASSQNLQADKRDRILKVFRDEFIPVTPGQGKYPKSFTMGSATGQAEEQPAHMVTFAYSFSMARYEVTQELYDLVMGNNPSKWKGPRNSAEKMTWKEANEFCAKATTLMQKWKLIDGGEEIRLPSEAEWEYVSRAGTTTAYSFGDDVTQLTHYCWFKGNSKGHDPPVGMKKPNPWGFYDMHGYVWEWCSDGWHPNYQDAPADGGPSRQGAKKYVIRGGSWTDPAEMARSAARVGVPGETKSDAIGFRCALAKKKGAGHGN